MGHIPSNMEWGGDDVGGHPSGGGREVIQVMQHWLYPMLLNNIHCIASATALKTLGADLSPNGRAESM